MRQNFDYVTMVDYAADMDEITENASRAITELRRENTELKTLIAVMVHSMGEIRIEKAAMLQCSGDDLTNGNIELYDNPKDFNFIYRWKGNGPK